MRRFPFDNLLVALNPADPRRLPFAPVVADARKRGMGVVGMKVLAAGLLAADRATSVPELIRYTASQTDTVIIGCSSVEEVRANLAVASGFQVMSASERTDLEQRLAPRAHRYDDFKRL